MATQATPGGRRGCSRPLVRALGVVVLVVLLVAPLAGCGFGPFREGGGVPGDGPLRALTGPPAALAPQSPGEAVTFGAVTLCTTVPGADLRLDPVEVDASPAPLDVAAWLRDVPAAADRDLPAAGWEPITAVAGSPPDGLAGGPWRGRLDPDLSAAYVATPCADAADLDQPRVELLLVVEASPAGTLLSQVRVTYRVGDDEHVLPVPVRMSVCGTAVPC